MSVPVYLINLRRDAGRLAGMTAQLMRLGLPFQRIEAVPGVDMPQWLRPYFLDIGGRIASPLLPGEVGCYASHLLACAIIAESGSPALVLEDDVEIEPDFPGLLHSLGSLPKGWDIVRLSNPHKRPVVQVSCLTDRYRLVKFVRVPPSTGAYLISPAGARKFLEWRKCRQLPVDQDLRRTWDNGMVTYGVFPRPITPDIGVSSIDAMRLRSRRRLPNMYGIGDRVMRAAHEVRWVGWRAWLAGFAPGPGPHVFSSGDEPEPLPRCDGRTAGSMADRTAR